MITLETFREPRATSLLVADAAALGRAPDWFEPGLDFPTHFNSHRVEKPAGSLSSTKWLTEVHVAGPSTNVESPQVSESGGSKHDDYVCS
jgi:hypothetical protein